MSFSGRDSMILQNVHWSV